jgi:hypothetical protein
MPQDLNVPADRPDDGSPVRSTRPRSRVSARIAAIAGLSMAVIMGVVAPAVAGPSPAQAGGFAQCFNDAIGRATAEAGRLPLSQRADYIRREVDAARARCGTLLPTPTPTPTPTPSPTTSTTTTSPGRYEITVTGVIGPGTQTLEANCRTGDRLVSYRYEIGSPTGSNRSRSVSVSTTGQGAKVTYTVTGTVANPQTSLTIVCRSA